MEQHDLKKLVRDCKKGKNHAYQQLVDTFSKRLYAYFYRLTGNRDHANEMLSELFLKVVKNIKKFKDGSFESWLYKIASNVFHDYLRAKQRKQKLNEQYIEKIKTDLSGSDLNSDMDYHLQNALSKISDDEKQIILMRYYSDVSFKEIAELRNEPIGTTLSKMHRSLKKLKDLISEK